MSDTDDHLVALVRILARQAASEALNARRTDQVRYIEQTELQVQSVAGKKERTAFVREKTRKHSRVSSVLPER